ncbi:E3 ubiquitin-protein ligase listerin, partial [Stegodyphus mimosarum]
MVMRKMLKRDVVTRLKAVQEFGNHCAEKDKDVVKNVLPFWPRLFNKLALDTDRRIREATHEANGKLIFKVKREVAPYLKNIMGVWLLGQCDLYAPAATSAQTTFTATFPSGKQSEALMFCKTEIFAYFKDNLFEQTAKTMSETNLTSAEDVENKYILVISATLKALKLFLTTILHSELQNFHEDLCSVVVENKFWKYAKNKESLIRSAWYSLISCLCRVKHDVFAEIEKKLVTAIFSCLSESDPVVAPSVWEATLHIIVKFENCWEGIDIHKVVLPQLWTLLKQGGRGNAHLLFPFLLPFLSKFPKEVVEEESFLLQFFSCLNQSLNLEGVRTSPMECDAILTTFMECLTYICFVYFDNKMFAPEFLEKVIISQIIPTVDSSFYDCESIHIAASKFYPLLGDLIKKTEQKIFSENEENSENYAKCLQVFWDNIINILCKIFEEKLKEKCRVSTYVAYFFNSMFSASAVIRNKKPKVRFEDEEKTDQSESSAKTASSKQTAVVVGTSFTRKNQSFQSVLRLYEILYSKINAECNICYLRIFEELVASTINKELFNEFLKTHVVPNDDEEPSVIFCQEVILKWAFACEGDYTCLSTIVDIIFCICCCVTEEEAVKILNSCCEAKNIVLLENILKKGLETSAENDHFEEWLKSSVLSETVLNILKETRAALDGTTRNDDCVSQRNVLGIYLTAEYSKGPVVDKNNVEKFLCTLKDFIDSKDVADLNYHVINFICDTSSKIFRNS